MRAAMNPKKMVALIWVGVLLCIGTVVYSDSDSDPTSDPGQEMESDVFLRHVLEAGRFEFRQHESLICDMTAYCPGPCCNTGYVHVNGVRIRKDWSDRIAAASVRLHELHACGIGVAAVDPLLIPLGSIIIYDGKMYMALDVGSAIKGRRIDISVYTHEESVVFGIRRGRKIDVYIPRDPSSVIRYVQNSAAGKGERRT